MTRVASLYLPDWSIDRLRRAERPHAPPEPDARRALDARDALGGIAGAERAAQCSVPREGGWRPGARWAKAELAAAIERLPAHQRPPMRELGRTSEKAEAPFRVHRSHSNVTPPVGDWSRHPATADHPFRPMPPDEAGAASTPSLADRAAMPAVRYPGEGPHPTKGAPSTPGAPYPGEGRFFQTGRSLGDVVSRSCREPAAAIGPAPPAAADPPLVTTHKIGSRVLLAAVSPAARAIGLRCGMALTQARAQVPGLAVRTADPDGDRADLAALATLLARRWTPVVAIADDDGLFLELTGVAHLHGGEARLARRLVRLLARHGVTARVAIADTAGAAWALARFGRTADRRASTAAPPTQRLRSDDGGRVTGGPQPGGNGRGAIGWAADPRRGHTAGDGGPVLIAAPGTHAELIAPLPVDALRLAAPATELLARLGIDTVGQLLALPRAPLVRRFGANVTTRLDQATGRAPEPLDPVVPATRIAVEQRFAEPIATAEVIAHWLGQLVPRLATALAAAGIGARAVELTAARVDGRAQRLRLGFARPTRDPSHLLRLALRRIEAIDPGFGIDALTLAVHRADPLAPQSLAPALAEPAAPDLAPLVDTLANRIGPARLWRLRAVASDVPERSVAPAPPLDPPARATAALRHDHVRQLDARPPDHPWHPRWPRPVRLLRRPEPLDHVMAELPDRPPVRFTWRGRTHRVLRADGPERIGGEWWRRPAERLAIRDYFRVEDEAGQRFWLYRSGDGVRPETGDLRWFLHGAFG